MKPKTLGTFEISAQVWSEFKLRAKEDNRSASAQIRHLIAEYLRGK